MAEDEILRQSRQYFIDKLSEKALDIRPLISRIVTFDQDLNETTDLMAIIMGDASPITFSATIGAGRASGVRIKLREDEFAAKTRVRPATTNWNITPAAKFVVSMGGEAHAAKARGPHRKSRR
jgi:hypothetical protein